MTYELAKQLKDAGFKTTIKFGQFYWDKDGKYEHWAWPEQREPSWEQGDWREPTLSELIEACGRDFGDLRRMINGRFGARNFNVTISTLENTSEEAVAKLWLALKGAADSEAKS